MYVFEDENERDRRGVYQIKKRRCDNLFFFFCFFFAAGQHVELKDEASSSQRRELLNFFLPLVMDLDFHFHHG